MNALAKTDQSEAVPVKESFYEAFVKLQADIRPAIKDATNPAFRSKYADLSAVWEAVREPLAKHGFGVVQAPQFEGETMFLETTLLHVGGDTMVSRYPLRPVKLDPQGFGSALTYAKRYALSAMLGVVADDDDDGNAASGRGNAAAAPARHAPTPAAAPEKPHYPEDPDVVEGIKNWLLKQQLVLSAAVRLPDLYMWLDEQSGNGSMTAPESGSPLGRLKRKSPDAFKEICQNYQTRIGQLSAKETA